MLASALADLIARHPNDDKTVLSLAREGDDPLLAQLNATVTDAAWTPDLMMRQDVSFFQSIRKSGGAALVMRDQNEVCGYSVAVPAGPDMPPFLGDNAQRIGLLFGTVVAEPYRSRGWQRTFVKLRLEAFSIFGIHTCQAVVAPANQWSLGNLLSEGFVVIGYEGQRTGGPRFVVQRGLDPLPGGSDEVTVLPLPPHGDVSAHTRLLDSGHMGFAVQHDGQLGLGYHRAASEANR
ncbi:MAG: hypothetical protein AAGF71_01470 [Pseudomonadota bacterium]